MSVQISRFANVWSQIKQIQVIFTDLKLWVAVARHNFKWLKMLGSLCLAFGTDNFKWLKITHIYSVKKRTIYTDT